VVVSKPILRSPIVGNETKLLTKWCRQVVRGVDGEAWRRGRFEGIGCGEREWGGVCDGIGRRATDNILEEQDVLANPWNFGPLSRRKAHVSGAAPRRCHSWNILGRKDRCGKSNGGAPGEPPPTGFPSEQTLATPPSPPARDPPSVRLVFSENLQSRLAVRLFRRAPWPKTPES